MNFNLMRLLLVAVLVMAGIFSAQANAPLRTGDAVSVRLGGVPASEISQVSGEYRIDGSGFINLPYIGRVQASGLTPGELQTRIQERYVSEEIFTSPTVAITSGAGQFVNVAGDAKAPQRVQYTPDLTLLKAIIAAGDFNEFANEKKVRVIRGKETFIIDVRRIRDGKANDFKLLPGDDVMIPRSIW